MLNQLQPFQKTLDAAHRSSDRFKLFSCWIIICQIANLSSKSNLAMARGAVAAQPHYILHNVNPERYHDNDTVQYTPRFGVD